ncbi:MAG: divergent polysaccharide deacetylase family protein [Comamonadaceae bacterium]|nr:divergent polysaccharide deacetylase family protein [Comamonadaceae bacterium]
MPNTPYADEAMEIATQNGHESIIHVPMEPATYPRENPGDHAIFIQQSAGEISRRIERFIKKLPDCIGINNHMGSLATADEPAMQAVMQTLRKHKLIFVDSRTTGNSIAYKVAQKNLVSAFKRDIFLDEPDLTEANMTKKLAECQTVAQSKSYVVAIMHCHTDKHLNYLKKFIARAEAEGFEIGSLVQIELIQTSGYPLRNSDADA